MHFFVKVANIQFLLGKYILLKKKDVYIFSCNFNVKVTSQSHVPIFGLLKGLEIEFYAFQMEKTFCINIAMVMLLEHNNSDSGILKRLH